MTSEHVSLAPETSWVGKGIAREGPEQDSVSAGTRTGAPLAGSKGVATFPVLATIAGLLSAPLTGLLASLLLLYIPFSIPISSK